MSNYKAHLSTRSSHRIKRFIDQGSSYKSTPSPREQTPQLTSPEASKLVVRANQIGKVPAGKRLDFHFIDIEENRVVAENIEDYNVLVEDPEEESIICEQDCIRIDAANPETLEGKEGAEGTEQIIS